MKILYGIQGTGHGHISRARELLPALSEHAQIDVMISGTASQLSINGGIKYRKHGISLSYDRHGGISVFQTLRNLRPIRFISDVQSTKLSKYDLVISDYEPVSSWSAKLEGVPSVALSHQASFLSPKTPRPNRQSLVAEAILQHFAPADSAIGFHFKRYDDFIESPIIRQPIRKLNVSKGNHITVYLPAYHHDVLQKIFEPYKHIDWHIFSPSCSEPQKDRNFWIWPVSNQPFLDSFASCRGIICNAGFETCAEAMYLQKKLLAIPIQKQYEQKCNAAALDALGIKILDTLEDKSNELGDWLQQKQVVTIRDIADPKEVIAKILKAEALVVA
jgi:uncharacterized protein (TIGR00661 family)